MSDSRFGHKRIGYLAASQAFTQSTDVVLLTTNTLKKELRGAIGPGMNGVYEAGLAINCLSNIVTEDLARELLQDVTNLTSHPQPYLRKKAILCLLKLFVKYPQGLRLTFHRIQKCLLQDSNPSVTSCAVNVITELSDKNPKNYLVLAPSFFALLTGSSNNWMLIKVVKLLGSLVTEEPRLARKLLEPLAQIVRSTQAKSLLYEAVFTISRCLPFCRKADGSMPAVVPSIVELCAETLRSLLQENDQNLKYLGLVGFGSLLQSYPTILAGSNYRGLILACLSDEDVTIRTRALDLLIGVATRKNAKELVTQLLEHVDRAGGGGSYRVDLVRKIVEICSKDRYAVLVDFGWYLDVLVGLARTMGGTASGGGGVEGENLGPLIAGQVVDVALRVLPVRGYAVKRMIGVLLVEGGGKGGGGGGSTRVNIIPEVLPSAAWIVGEYASLIDDNDDDDNNIVHEPTNHYNSNSKGTYHATVQALTDPSNVESLATTSQSVYVQAAMKVLAAASSSSNCSDLELEAVLGTLARHLPVFMQSMNVEVQERAFTSFRLLSGLGLIVRALPTQQSDGDFFGDLDMGEDSSSDERSVTKGHDGTDDLLGLMGESSSTKPPPNTKRTKSTTITRMSFNPSKNNNNNNKNIASNCRAASTTLNYILIPELMKPISSKAQRKKRQSAPPGIKAMLEAPVNLSVFTKHLVDDGTKATSSSGRKVGCIESVNFTQQKPMKPAANTRRQAFESGGHPPIMGVDSLAGGGGGAQNGSSFQQQQSRGAELNVGTSLNTARRDEDPFYLNSTAVVENTDGTGSGNRFGTIQLVDSDDDDKYDEDNRRSGLTKKKKKKEKKRKKKQMLDTDLMLLGSGFGVGTPSTMNDTHHPNTTTTKKAAILKVYVSDDDDDDEGEDRGNNPDHARHAPPSGRTSSSLLSLRKQTKVQPNLQEFEGLAKVDLTTPLGADEFIPVNTHRVVPPVAEGRNKKKNKKKKGATDPIIEGTRHSSSHDAAYDDGLNRYGGGGGKKHGKKRKKKEKSTQSSSSTANKREAYTGAPHVMDATADLLDLTGLGSSGNGHSNDGFKSNPVNNAFDDLLDLQAPTAPASLQQLEDQSAHTFPSSFTPSTEVSKSKDSFKVWQLGSIKVSQASGGDVPSIDWSQVALLYRTYISKKKKSSGGALSLRFRLVNRISDRVLENVQIHLKEDVYSGGSINLEDAEPGTAVESKKVQCELGIEVLQGLSPEIRGTISASGWKIPIKVILPSTAALSPISDLTQDQAGSLLSDGQWSSYTSKVNVSTESDSSKLKHALESFLQAAEVEPEHSNLTNGMFATQSMHGAKVLILVKLGEQNVKIDLKSTDKKLAKALSSDLKRLVL